MNPIEQLKSRPDLLRDPDNLKATGENVTVFSRVAKDMSEGNLGHQVDMALRKQAEGWSAMAHQVVGSANF
jgi:hypothetical protein